MNKFKLNLDMNMVNCVLLLVVLILVLLCCYNKEQFQQAIRKPNCKKLHPCVMDKSGSIGVDSLTGIDWETQQKRKDMQECQKDMFSYPEDIYKNKLNGRYTDVRDIYSRDGELMNKALKMSCRAPEHERVAKGKMSDFCKLRRNYNDDFWNTTTNIENVPNTILKNIVNECNMKVKDDGSFGGPLSGRMCRIPEDKDIDCNAQINDDLLRQQQFRPRDQPVSFSDSQPETGYTAPMVYNPQNDQFYKNSYRKKPPNYIHTESGPRLRRNRGRRRRRRPPMGPMGPSPLPMGPN